MFLLFHLVPFLSSNCLTPVHKGSDYSYLLAPGWWDAKFRYRSVSVFFPYTVDFTLPSSFLVNFTSRNSILFFSLVNLMLQCSYINFPVCSRHITSSTFHFQFLGLQLPGAVIFFQNLNDVVSDTNLFLQIHYIISILRLVLF